MRRTSFFLKRKGIGKNLCGKASLCLASYGVPYRSRVCALPEGPCEKEDF